MQISYNISGLTTSQYLIAPDKMLAGELIKSSNPLCNTLKNIDAKEWQILQEEESEISKITSVKCKVALVGGTCLCLTCTGSSIGACSYWWCCLTSSVKWLVIDTLVGGCLGATGTAVCIYPSGAFGLAQFESLNRKRLERLIDKINQIISQMYLIYDREDCVDELRQLNDVREKFTNTANSEASKIHAYLKWSVMEIKLPRLYLTLPDHFTLENHRP